MKTTKTKIILISIAAVTALCMSGCTDNQSEKPQPKPAEMLTGRAAFQKSYISARGWAADAQPFRLTSQPTSDSDGHDGKADVWLGSFGSASQHAMKTFSWCGTNVADAPERGVIPGSQDTYNPDNSSTHAFNLGFLKIDSDKAFDEAQKHGGDKLLQQDPKTPVFYVLDWSSATNELIWHVIYGPSRESAKLAVSINATTGTFMRVEK
ncbi:MAG TPA: hypothetical protein VN684_03580 [Terriglobales bacterium]|nr:hypothetical protein [Terriglobales bacterium]